MLLRSQIQRTASVTLFVGVDLDGRAELALVRSLSEGALTGASVVWRQVSQGGGELSFLPGGRVEHPYRGSTVFEFCELDFCPYQYGFRYSDSSHDNATFSFSGFPSIWVLSPFS